VAAARASWEGAGVEWRSAAIESRYRRIAGLQEDATTEAPVATESVSDRLDRVPYHKIWGVMITVVVMALLCKRLCTFAHWPMDGLMSKVGLHGKSFIPMLSSFACAIPGIMATRTIESPKDRLVTILVAPLMSCSARLPVYTVLIAACIPDRRLFGFWKLSGITMLAMYLLGIIVALLMAWLFKKTLLKGPTPMLIMELPPYKRPVPRVVLRHMWD